MNLIIHFQSNVQCYQKKQHLPTYKHDFLKENRWLTKETNHYVFHYFPESEAEKDIEMIVTTQEKAFKKIIAFLNIEPPKKKIEYYFYPDEKIKKELGRYETKRSSILPILHAIQDALGYVPTESITAIAKALNLSRAEVHGVISFYHYFRDTPPGKHTIHLCRAESCQAMGGKQLEEHVKTRLGIDFHETTADGKFSLEPVLKLSIPITS